MFAQELQWGHFSPFWGVIEPSRHLGSVFCLSAQHLRHVTFLGEIQQPMGVFLERLALMKSCLAKMETTLKLKNCFQRVTKHWVT